MSREFAEGDEVVVTRTVNDLYDSVRPSAEWLHTGSRGYIHEIRDSATSPEYSDTTIVVDGVLWEVNRACDLGIIQ